MALSTLVSLRIGSDSMFELHYFRPFLISLCISILMITGMGLSLKGMSGTGAGQVSTVRGEAVVRVNFDASGNVIVGVNTPRIVEDLVPPNVRDEAIRIIKTSGSIVNKRGQVVSLAIPVVLGQ